MTEDTGAAQINGYSLNATAPVDVTVSAGQTAEAVFTNIYAKTEVPDVPDPDPADPVYPDNSGSPPEPVNPAKPAEPKDPDEPKTELPGAPASIQEKALRKDRREILDWVDRLELPEYARTLYDVMSGSTAGSPSVFEDEGNFILPATAGAAVADVDRIEAVDFELTDLFGGQGELAGSSFEDEDFYTVPVGGGDKAVDYAGLAPGGVVRTSTFNGIYVTKIPRNGGFDAKKKETCEYVTAAYHAYDRDHPEVFWLSGKCKTRIVTATDPGTGSKAAYFFLVLADADGFTMLAPAWTGTGSITGGIARRDAAVAAILSTVTAGDTAGKIKQLNKWLTEHNEYNTTADLTSIGNEPHECLSALEGRAGTDGPVCDGYSRAFKVLCDRLSIPCVLETGWSRTSADAEAGFHMWNLAQVGGTWYGADVTWDDPVVPGSTGPLSGRENEKYLLVGTDTVIGALAFGQSHVTQNQAAPGGVDFSNGPVLNQVAYAGLSAQVFEDVPEGAYYYDGVLWAVDRGITSGTSPTAFSPEAPCTQAQILTFLWRAAGKPAGDAECPVGLSTGSQYAEDALGWAAGLGMIDGAFLPDAPCTRASTVKYMWQAEGSPVGSGGAFRDVPAGSGYKQAVAWAVRSGVTDGTSPDTFSPDEICTRAQIATFLCRDRA